MELHEFLPPIGGTAPRMRAKKRLFHTFITPHEGTYIDIPSAQSKKAGELMNYQENTHEQNLEKNALTQKLINAGADEIDIGIAESIHGLVNQVALYRGVSHGAAKKIVGQLLREVTK